MPFATRQVGFDRHFDRRILFQCATPDWLYQRAEHQVNYSALTVFQLAIKHPCRLLMTPHAKKRRHVIVKTPQYAHWGSLFPKLFVFPSLALHIPQSFYH